MIILYQHLFISFLNATSFYNPFYRISSLNNVPNASISTTDSINLTRKQQSTSIFDWFNKVTLTSTTSPSESIPVDEDISNGTETESSYHIQEAELMLALEQSLKIMEASEDDIKGLGWKLVQKAENFCLYKRRSRPKNEGPYEYFMKGEFSDVSPRAWLQCQTNKNLRAIWDDTMKSMSVIHDANQNHTTTTTDTPTASSVANGIDNEDIIYYRTKWYTTYYLYLSTFILYLY